MPARGQVARLKGEQQALHWDRPSRCSHAIGSVSALESLMLILTMVSTPAMAQDTCSVAQHAYDNCLQQAVPRYWNLKRIGRQLSGGQQHPTDDGTQLGLGGGWPDEFGSIAVQRIQDPNVANGMP